MTEIIIFPKCIGAMHFMLNEQTIIWYLTKSEFLKTIFTLKYQQLSRKPVDQNYAYLYYIQMHFVDEFNHGACKRQALWFDVWQEH